MRGARPAGSRAPAPALRFVARCDSDVATRESHAAARWRPPCLCTALDRWDDSAPLLIVASGRLVALSTGQVVPVESLEIHNLGTIDRLAERWFLRIFCELPSSHLSSPGIHASRRSGLDEARDAPGCPALQDRPRATAPRDTTQRTGPARPARGSVVEPVGRARDCAADPAVSWSSAYNSSNWSTSTAAAGSTIGGRGTAELHHIIVDTPGFEERLYLLAT
jgi:hypothetical protein